MKTLLQVPDLLTAIEPLIEGKLTSEDVFRLIGSGKIKPFGFVKRMPIFSLDQIAEITSVVKGIYGERGAVSRGRPKKCRLKPANQGCVE